MKRIYLFFLIVVVSFSVTAQQLVGAVNMITNRNIDFRGNHQLLQKNTGLDEFALTNNRAATFQEAVDKAVLSVPCGEFIMNAQIYSYENSFVIIGDVWGITRNSCLYQIGDKVAWGKYKVGEIVSIKNDDECIVKDLQNGSQKEFDFDDLHKVDDNYAYYKVGDKVTWGKNNKGVIVSIKDDDECVVQDSQSGKQQEIDFDDLYRADNVSPFFKVGDKVSWKVMIGGKYKTGVIVAIKDEDRCLVKDLETGKQKEVEFDDLYKIEE